MVHQQLSIFHFLLLLPHKQSRNRLRTFWLHSSLYLLLATFRDQSSVSWFAIFVRQLLAFYRHLNNPIIFAFLSKCLTFLCFTGILLRRFCVTNLFTHQLPSAAWHFFGGDWNVNLFSVTNGRNSDVWLVESCWCLILLHKFDIFLFSLKYLSNSCVKCDAHIPVVLVIYCQQSLRFLPSAPVVVCVKCQLTQDSMLTH